MQKKHVFLLSTIIALMSFGPAMAQPSGKLEIVSSDGNNRLGFKGLLQENNQFSYRKNGAQKDLGIGLNRARVSMHGTVVDPRLTFLVQAAADKAGPNHELVLSDYYVNFSHHDRYAQLRVGKFTVPFARREIASAALAQFYDGDAATNKFNLGKDAGFMLHNGHQNDFEWAFAAVSQGVVARLGYNHNGIDGYDMVDWTGGDLRFGVGINGYLPLNYLKPKLADVRGGLDFIAKVAHFSTNGAFYYQWKKANEADKASHNLGAGLDLGYLVKGNIEPVVRYSWNKEGEGDNNHEILGGVNYYFYGHNFKLQAYAGVDLGGKEISLVQGLGGVQIQLAI